MHSADRIDAEWQNLKAGDVLRSREDRPGMRVEILEPERTLSNRSEAGDWIWTFVLVPENGSTRLISRNRIAMKGAAAGQHLACSSWSLARSSWSGRCCSGSSSEPSGHSTTPAETANDIRRRFASRPMRRGQSGA
jgi:hypothetical protein